MKKRRPILARINKPLGPFIGEPQITANAANQPVTRVSHGTQDHKGEKISFATNT